MDVLGEIAIHDGARVFGVDIATLLRRLVLFDRVVIQSVRLRDVPLLIRSFGRTGFRELFRSGILQISCEFTFVLHDVAKNGVRDLPPSHFSLGIGEIASREQLLRNELRALQGIPGLKNDERSELEDTIINGLVRPASDYGAQLQRQIEADIRSNTPALKAAVDAQLGKRFKNSVPSYEIRVDEVRERVFHLVTNLSTVLGNEDNVHSVLQPAIGAVANLNQRLADMAAYSAITGFNDAEAPLLFGKIAGVIRPINPRPLEEEFARVITIAHVPDFVSGGKIDVERLLRARESPECLEFRAWLNKLEGLSNEQIAELVSSVKNRMGSFVRSETGKALRLAATTGLGLIPGLGLILGAAAGVADSFLVERLLPTSGAVAFLTETYPSLFDAPKQ